MKFQKTFTEFLKHERVLENVLKIAFDEEIKHELKQYLKNTIWNKVDNIDNRADQLISLHSKFINNVRDKMSADEIAKRLFEYEKNILKNVKEY